MNEIQLLEQQQANLLKEQTNFSKTLRDNMTARSRSGRRARRNAEQQLRRINRQLDDVNRKLLQLNRVGERTDRQENRQETKQTAFQHGIDPNASMWGGISSLGSSVSGIFGGQGNAQNQQTQARTQKNNNLFIFAGIGALLLLILKKK